MHGPVAAQTGIFAIWHPTHMSPFSYMQITCAITRCVYDANMSIYPILAALAVMIVSLVGVILTIGRIGSWLRRNLTYLATFAGGVFILVAWHLAEEAAHEGGWMVAISAMLAGALIMESINFFFPAHHHHGVEHDHAHTPIDGRRVLFSDALHNIGDGILIFAAFSADFYIGIVATVGVLLHEFVQEISEFFVLKESGYSNRAALTWNFLVSTTIFIGLFLAATLSSMEIIVAILSGVAAGGFAPYDCLNSRPWARIHSRCSCHSRGGVDAWSAVIGSARRNRRAHRNA